LDFASGFEVGDLSGFEAAANAGMEPADFNVSFDSGEIQFSGSAVGEVDDVGFAFLGQAVLVVLVLGVADEGVGVFHGIILKLNLPRRFVAAGGRGELRRRPLVGGRCGRRRQSRSWKV
jgi:hypothetical protein